MSGTQSPTGQARRTIQLTRPEQGTPMRSQRPCHRTERFPCSSACGRGCMQVSWDVYAGMAASEPPPGLTMPNGQSRAVMPPPLAGLHELQRQLHMQQQALDQRSVTHGTSPILRKTKQLHARCYNPLCDILSCSCAAAAAACAYEPCLLCEAGRRRCRRRRRPYSASWPRHRRCTGARC